MIHYISGTILDRNQNTYLVVTNNVGYEIAVPHNYTHLPQEKIELFVHPHISQDQYQLFGFSSKAEKIWFQRLIGLSGIGPKTGLQILSKNIQALERAISEQNQAFFESVSGIGKKTAQKILIELADKPLPTSNFRPATPYNEAFQTLLELGFPDTQVRLMLNEAPTDLSAAQLVTLALKQNAQKNYH